MAKEVRTIQSIQRAINIINCFTEENPELSLNDISDRLDLNINTTRGIVNTLLYNGFLEHYENTNTYSLGIIFLEKNKLVKNIYALQLEKKFTPLLYELANKYSVSARIQLISNNTILTIKTVNPEYTRYKLIASSFHFPLNATSSGKLFLYYAQSDFRNNYLDNIPDIKHSPYTICDKKELLKEMDFIKKNGYSKEIQEIDIGVSSVAVPILNINNELIGTISVTGLSTIIEEVCNSLLITVKDYFDNDKDFNTSIK